MFTQLFGGYLLNNQVVNAQQLCDAMQAASQLRPKLGVLAINAGYLTAQQVEECHSLQSTMNMRMGDIAVNKGYITKEQVEELLASQKNGYLALGQALIDEGVLTAAEFEKQLNSYKASSAVSEAEIDESGKSRRAVLDEYCNISDEDCAVGVDDYMVLLFDNIVRFIGNEFSVLQPEKAEYVNCECFVTQTISGTNTWETAICADKAEFEAIAAKYAQEELDGNQEYIEASIGEFLNLNNGLFAVNLSQQKGEECDLQPQQTLQGAYKAGIKSYIIPIQFTFGIVRFVVSVE